MNILYEVCAERPCQDNGSLFCALCGRSLDRLDDYTHYAIIKWAARRARWFAERRARRARRTA